MSTTKSIGPFKALGQIFASLVSVTTVVAEGVEEYGRAFKKSGEMANAAIDNAKEEQLMELDDLRAKRKANKATKADKAE